MDIKTADRLIDLRKEHGYSQEDLASYLGISRQSVSKWERAEASPDTDNLISLAKLYKISLDNLLGNTPEANTKNPADVSPSVTQASVSSTENESDYFQTASFKDSDEKCKCSCDNKRNIPLTSEEKFRVEHDLHLKYKCYLRFILDGILTLSSVIVYICIGFIFDLWHPGWLVFFIPVVVNSIMDVIIYKDFRRFSFAVLITGIFLYFGFTTGLWYILWVVFLLIPFYHPFIAELLNMAIKGGRYDPDHSLRKRYGKFFKSEKKRCNNDEY